MGALAITAGLVLSLSTPAVADIPTGPFAVATIADVPYGPVAAVSDASGSVSGNTLIECLPRPTAAQWAGPYPIVMFVHGGSWRTGKATSALHVCQKWASRGFAAFTINYRLQADPVNPGRVGYAAPAQFVDVQLALRWIRQNAVALSAAKTEATCFGDSAGAALCEQTALYPGRYPSAGDPAVDLYPDVSSKAQSFVAEFGPSLFGPAPLTSELAQTYAAKSSKAVLVQGSSDRSVPEANSLAVYQPLHDRGRPATYISFEGGHEFAGLTDAQSSAIRVQELRLICDHVRYFGFPVSKP